MTAYAYNGCADDAMYGRFENEDVFWRFIELSTGFGRGTVYTDCGWMLVKGHSAIDNNAELITNEMLDNVKHEDDFDALQDMETGVFFDDFDEEV